MEHNHHDLHEAAHITGEALEGVSGGGDVGFPNIMCTNCGRNINATDKAIYQGEIVCKKCKERLENSAAARAL